MKDSALDTLTEMNALERTPTKPGDLICNWGGVCLFPKRLIFKNGFKKGLKLKLNLKS